MPKPKEYSESLNRKKFREKHVLSSEGVKKMVKPNLYYYEPLEKSSSNCVFCFRLLTGYDYLYYLTIAILEL